MLSGVGHRLFLGHVAFEGIQSLSALHIHRPVLVRSRQLRFVQNPAQTAFRVFVAIDARVPR